MQLARPVAATRSLLTKAVTMPSQRRNENHTLDARGACEAVLDNVACLLNAVVRAGLQVRQKARSLVLLPDVFSTTVKEAVLHI